MGGCVIDPASNASVNAHRAPAVDVRVAVFSVNDGALQIAEMHAGDEWSLPRTVPAVAGSLDAHARRLITEELAIPIRYLEQLYTLSVETGRGWTVVVSYLALVDRPPVQVRAIRWTDVDKVDLDETDRMVLDYAVTRLRAKVGYTTIAFRLIPAPFTLSDVQSTYEAILDRPLDKRNFRRRLSAAAVLVSTGEKRRDGSHRPAVLYTARIGDDQEAYLTPSWSQSLNDSELP